MSEVEFMNEYLSIYLSSIYLNNQVDKRKKVILMVFYFGYPNIEVFAKSVMGKLLLTGQLPSCINKNFGGNTYLSMYCLWLLSCYNSSFKWLRQKPYGLQA